MDNRKLKLLVMPNCQELGEKIAKELQKLNNDLTKDLEEINASTAK